jgi:uncharacterized alpha-E superfamily protein
LNITKEISYIQNYVSSTDRKPRSLARALIEVERHLERIVTNSKATEQQKHQAQKYVAEIQLRANNVDAVELAQYRSELEDLDSRTFSRERT